MKIRSGFVSNSSSSSFVIISDEPLSRELLQSVIPAEHPLYPHIDRLLVINTEGLSKLALDPGSGTVHGRTFWEWDEPDALSERFDLDNGRVTVSTGRMGWY